MSRRTTDYDRPRFPPSRISLSQLVGIGLTAGLIGGAIMTGGQKIEQAITGRPNSLVPGLTLARLLGRPDGDKVHLNLVLHYLQAAGCGLIRAYMSFSGIRGPIVDFFFTGIRIGVDQSLENYTGAGAPPWTWPVEEQWIDIIHKGVYGFVTGWLCDLWIQ